MVCAKEVLSSAQCLGCRPTRRVSLQMRGFSLGCKGTGQTIVVNGSLSYKQSSRDGFKTRRGLTRDEILLSEDVSVSRVNNVAERMIVVV
jgi:hypothetical protein